MDSDPFPSRIDSLSPYPYSESDSGYGLGVGSMFAFETRVRDSGSRLGYGLIHTRMSPTRNPGMDSESDSKAASVLDSPESESESVLDHPRVRLGDALDSESDP